MECVLCGVDDIAEPIVFVHFLLFDLMRESFQIVYKIKHIEVFSSRVVTFKNLCVETFHVKIVSSANTRKHY